MNRATKMRSSQPSERDNNVAMQINRAQQQAVLTGSVAILWDMENCPVPSEVKADDVAGNIRMALRLHPVIQGVVTFFNAYGDFNHFPRKVREGCQRTGVNLIDVPNGKKDASDKAILVDLFLFALDNAPPCTIFLISGDVDFAPALHKLGQRGYTVVLAIPSGVGVSSALCSAGRYVWDWPCVARGGGLVPAKNFSSRVSVDERMSESIEMSVYPGQPGPGWSDDSDLASDDQVPYEDEQIVWKSPAPNRSVDHNVADGSPGSKLDASQRNPGGSSSTHSSSGKQSQGLHPQGARELANQVTGAREMSTAARTQADSTGPLVTKGRSPSPTLPTGNLQALREQLVRLLSHNGGKLELGRVSAEYQKQYGKPLHLPDYGHAGSKLVNLLERLREWLFMRGEGASRTLHLTKTGSRLASKLRRDAKSSRSVLREEVEVNDSTKIQAEDLGDAEDETAGEEVVVQATQNVQTLIEEVQTLLIDVSDPQKSDRQQTEEPEETRIPITDWGFGLGGSGDEKDRDPQEEKDVEVDESTLEQIVKNEVITRGAGSDILDVFRVDLQELLVSHACKIVMTSFVELYEQRYSRVLDCEKYGAQDLESLIEKVSNIAVITEEPGTNIKFLVAS